MTVGPTTGVDLGDLDVVRLELVQERLLCSPRSRPCRPAGRTRPAPEARSTKLVGRLLGRGRRRRLGVEVHLGLGLGHDDVHGRAGPRLDGLVHERVQVGVRRFRPPARPARAAGAAPSRRPPGRQARGDRRRTPRAPRRRTRPTRRPRRRSRRALRGRGSGLGDARLARAVALGAPLRRARQRPPCAPRSEQLALGRARAVGRPAVREARPRADDRALDAVERGLDVAVDGQQDRHHEPDREHDERADRAEDGRHPPRDADPDAAGPVREVSVGPQVQPAEKARREKRPGDGEPGQERQKDRRLLAQQHVAPREQAREHGQDRVADEVGDERLCDDAPTMPSRLSTRLSVRSNRPPAVAGDPRVVRRGVAHDGEPEQERERHQDDAEHLLLALDRDGRLGAFRGARVWSAACASMCGAWRSGSPGGGEVRVGRLGRDAAKIRPDTASPRRGARAARSRRSARRVAA